MVFGQIHPRKTGKTNARVFNFQLMSRCRMVTHCRGATSLTVAFSFRWLVRKSRRTRKLRFQTAISLGNVAASGLRIKPGAMPCKRWSMKFLDRIHWGSWSRPENPPSPMRGRKARRSDVVVKIFRIEPGQHQPGWRLSSIRWCQDGIECQSGIDRPYSHDQAC